MTTSILVLGASGGLGRHIVGALGREQDVMVRLGVRDRVAAVSKLGDVAGGNADYAEVDLADQSSLARACEGIDVVISAVQGGPDVIIDGQTMLMHAAQQAGVRRLIPSDFSFNHFALQEGKNWNSDLRRAFADILRSNGMGHTFFFNGAFMEAMISPFMQMVDVGAGTLSFWGDAETPIDLTSMRDAAAFCVATALDPGTLNRTVEVVGQRATITEIAEAFSSSNGRPLVLHRLGSVEDGYLELEQVKRANLGTMAALPLMYQLPMMTERARLRNVQNERFPQIEPITLSQLLASRTGMVG